MSVSTSRIGGVVLAAGAGRRMGHRPKGALRRDGEPLLRRICHALLHNGVAPVVVVLGHHAEVLGPLLRGLPVQPVLNPDPAAGVAGSQRLGLLSLPDDLDAVVMALADQPLLEAADVGEVLAAWAARGPAVRWLQPEVDDVPGHPVVFDADVRREVLAVADADHGPRRWRQAHPASAAAFHSADRRYVTDLDSEDDLQRLARETGIRLGWT
jgi:CTP:molybdopterin cytidylyltransferase MocA